MEKPTHRILTNVYFVYSSYGEFSNEAVPEYELREPGVNPDEPGSFHGFLYMEEGDLGWFKTEDFNDEFENEEGSSSRIREEYVELI